MNQASDKQTSKYHGEQAESATYAIGNLHGEVTLLRRLLEHVAPGSAFTRCPHIPGARPI